ncbi:MAG: GntR family transcriptional regulator [Oscillibacter sp.]|nr:GntR family transcriptional regulator [Oscillibacter sp.]
MEPIIKAFKKKNFSDQAYESLLSYISQLLEQGRGDGNLKLPPETELAKQLGVSRATLRQVLTELEMKGIVVRIHGKGTFVSGNYRKPSPFTDCAKLIEDQGYTSTCHVVQVQLVESSSNVQADLALKDKTLVWQIDTIYEADGHPCIILRDWFPARNVNREPDKDLLEKSFYEFLVEETGEFGSHEYSTIYASPGKELSSFFGEDYFYHDALITHEVILYGQNSHPICKTFGFFHPEYVKLHYYGKVNAE